MKNKKTFCLFASAVFLIGVKLNAQSQNYQLFRTDGGFHAARLMGNNSGMGYGIFVAPKFNITDNISAGLNTTVTFFPGHNAISNDGSSSEVSVGTTIMTSYGLVGEYFFGTGKARPYAGLAFGRYAFVSQQVNTSSGSSTGANVSVSQRAAVKYGLEPEVGISLPGIRFSVSYNMLFGGTDILMTTSASSSSASAGVSTQALNYSYFAFKLGFTVGGKKK